MFRIWMSLLGCQIDSDETAENHWELQDPVITQTEWDCDTDTWSIIVQTDGWTGNGLVWIGDVNRYERHPIYSIEASSDGSSDRLRINLTSTADWRDAQSGTLTGFYCDEKERLSLFILIKHPQTLETSDCAQLDGDQSNAQDIWDSVSLPTCP